VTGQGVMVLN